LSLPQIVRKADREASKACTAFKRPLMGKKSFSRDLMDDTLTDDGL